MEDLELQIKTINSRKTKFLVPKRTQETLECEIGPENPPRFLETPANRRSIHFSRWTWASLIQTHLTIALTRSNELKHESTPKTARERESGDLGRGIGEISPAALRGAADALLLRPRLRHLLLLLLRPPPRIQELESFGGEREKERDCWGFGLR